MTFKEQLDALLGKRSGFNTDSAVALIKESEGFVERAYLDGKNLDGSPRYSIGYGTKADKGDYITKDKADKDLRKHLSGVVKQLDAIEKKGNYNFTDNQKTALLSFGYHIGNFEELTNKGTRSIAEIEEAIPKYKMFQGKVNSGLVKRRAIELDIFKDNGSLNLVHNEDLDNITVNVVDDYFKDRIAAMNRADNRKVSILDNFSKLNKNKVKFVGNKLIRKKDGVNILNRDKLDEIYNEFRGKTELGSESDAFMKKYEELING